jgi:hypothetical protein
MAGLFLRRQPVVEATIYDAFLARLQEEGGYLATADNKRSLEAVMWDASLIARRHRRACCSRDCDEGRH